MKIMICGSMTFAKEMIKTKKKLEQLGHLVLVPLDLQSHIGNPSLVDDLESNYKHAVKTDIMRKCFGLVEESDAILVLNYPKNGIAGYIGTSSLMEIGLAYYLGKKIFILDAIPNVKQARWGHEISIMQPIILNGRLEGIR